MTKRNGLRLVASVVLALIVVPASSVSAAPAMRPDGKWSVDYASNMCVLSRTFRADSLSVKFALQPSPGTDAAKIVLIEDSPRRASKVGEAEVLLSDGSRPKHAPAFSAWSNNQLVTTVELARSALEPLKSKQGTIRIRFGDADYGLIPGGMDAAFQALRLCERDLLKIWGMSQADLDAMATSPVGDQGEWFRASDYPSKLIDRGVQGFVGALISVDSVGKPSSCRVIESSGSPELDELTCRLIMKRASFVPARSQNGQPMAALTFHRIAWRLAS